MIRQQKRNHSKFTDADTLKNIFDIICGLEFKVTTSNEEFSILQQPEYDIIITLKSNQSITFYYSQSS